MFEERVISSVKSKQNKIGFKNKITKTLKTQTKAVIHPLVINGKEQLKHHKIQQQIQIK